MNPSRTVITLPEQMQRVHLKGLPLRPPNPFSGWGVKLHGIVLALFLSSALLVWLRLCFPGRFFAKAHWPDGLLLLVSVGTTLIGLSRHLPAQNVILAGVTIGVGGGAAASLSVVTGMPFGQLVYHPGNIGRLLFYPLPWTVPLIWVVAILNCRGVARLMLRRYRTARNYGLWLLGMTVLLALVFELSFEPFATVVKNYWSWKPTRIHSDWYSTPWVNFLGWTATSGLLLLFVTPALINKRPAKLPPNYHPLIVWEGLGCIFVTSSARARLLSATVFIAAQMIVTLIVSLLAVPKGQLTIAQGFNLGLTHLRSKSRRDG